MTRTSKHGIPMIPTPIVDHNVLGAELIVSDNMWASFMFTKLLVRPSQIRFYEEYVHTRKWRNVILLGSPGIGKSAVGMYAVYRGLREGRVVIWHYVNQGNICFVYDKDTVQEMPVGDVRVRQLKGDEATFCIYDGVTPDLTGEQCQRLLISSPRRDIWYPYSKFGAVIKYLGPPTVEEVLLMRRECFSDLTEKQVMGQIEVHGPNLRACFTKAFEWDQEYMRGLIASLPMEELENSRQLNQSGKDNPCHRVFGIMATDNFDDGGRQFVSEFVARTVVSTMVEKHHDAFVQWLASAARDPTSNSFHSIFSDVFETMSVEIFAAGGKFKTRDLITGEFKTMEFPKQDVQNFKEVAKLSQLDGVIYVAPHKKFPALDALIYGSKMLRTINATINAQHTVLMLSANQKDGLHILEGILPCDSREHVFLVPEARFDQFEILSPSKFKWATPSENNENRKKPIIPLALDIEEKTSAVKKWGFRSVAIPFQNLSKRQFSSLRQVLKCCRR